MSDTFPYNQKNIQKYIGQWPLLRADTVQVTLHKP